MLDKQSRGEVSSIESNTIQSNYIKYLKNRLKKAEAICEMMNGVEVYGEGLRLNKAFTEWQESKKT